ncbi:MAG: 50S ribosomal protein L5, partial [Candidatus Levybacteria bacterium]|nr:50S ribosomal protein L5 [Candidatus Levybacteria bacterium]
MNRLMQKYRENIVGELQKELSISNMFDVPKISKIVISMGVKDALSDKKSIDSGLELLAQVSGQKPKITKAKKSISTFKLREGDKIGVTVTLRGKRMYEFLEKLINVVLPRIRDF